MPTGTNGHWAEINESIARELGWCYEPHLKPLVWKSPHGSCLRVFPDYVGDLSSCTEIFDYCADHHVNAMLYFQLRGSAPFWICSLFSKTVVRTEADTAQLALAKAFLLLRRQMYD